MRHIVKHTSNNWFDRVFESFWQGWPREDAYNYIQCERTHPPTVYTPSWQRTDKSFEYSVNMPGCAKEDISVELEDDYIVIKGERKHQNAASLTYSHEVSLPFGATEADITASYKDGVLTVSIPVQPKPEPRKIVVT